MHRILVGDLKVNCLGVLDVDGRLILKWVLEKHDVNCFHVAQDIVQWQTLVDMVMNNWVSSSVCVCGYVCPCRQTCVHVYQLIFKA
jgi:hypothetical protein